MSLNFVANPYSYYNNRNKTGPLFNGFIYVGIPDLDPTIIANQKQVTAKQEDGTQVPIAQPIRTNSGGYAVDSAGNPVVLLVDGNYSIRVNDKNGQLALEQSDVNEGTPITINDQPVLSVDNIEDLGLFEPEFDGQQISLLGHTLPGIGGGTFYFDESDTTSPDNNGTIIVTTGGARWKRESKGVILIEDFGALSGTDSTASIQAAEDFCSSVGGVLSSGVGDFRLTSSIIKKSGSDWFKVGRLVLEPSVTIAFPLVYTSDNDNWSIDDCSFQAARHETITASSSAATDLNACIAIERCNEWRVTNCKIDRYSSGLFFSDCNEFVITGNICTGDTGKDIDGYEAGTFTPFSSNIGTGDIMSDQQLGVVTPPSTNFTISNNVCFSVGLDIGINICTQAYERTPGVVDGNVVSGQYSGIQAYKGSLTDPGDTETYQRNVVISNNLVQQTYHQGIYVRLTFGCLVQGNMVRKSNMNGVLSDVGTPYGGIITRVSISSQGGSVISPVSSDVGNLIDGNMVLDIGRNSVGCMAAMQLRTESTTISNNFVAQSEELYGATPRPGVGVNVADNVVNFSISNNTIQNITSGIIVSRTAWSNSRTSKIESNRITNTAARAIDLDSFMAVDVSRNKIDNFLTGIVIRRAPYSKAIGNSLTNGSDGIRLSQGNYHSDIDNRSTNRIGQTLIIKDNIFNDVSEPHDANEITGVDAFFFSRCAIFRGDIVDGIQDEYRRAGANPQTTSNQKSWSAGDTIKNSTPTSGADINGVCTTSGTYGTLSGVTGGITTGTPTLTVNDSDGLAPNVYITIVGVAGVKRILDVTGLVITLDSNADATVAGAAVAYAVPVFNT